jgi:hypothetical protein
MPCASLTFLRPLHQTQTHANMLRALIAMKNPVVFAAIRLWGWGCPPQVSPHASLTTNCLTSISVPCYLRTMWDFITALIGGKHCGWCTDKPDGYLMRRFDGTGKRSARPLTHQAFWLFLDFNYWLGIWKLGQEWHYRIHERRKGPATWR